MINNSEEKNFIISLIFHEKIDNESNIGNLNLNRIIKISSSELIIPLIYFKLKKINLLNKFETEFIDYIKKIYELNLERNQILLNEVRELSEILKNEGVKHCFIKGSAMLAGGFYESIGNRMVGDIDFMFHKKNKSKMIQTLEKKGYNELNFSFFNVRHLKRRLKKENIFAIEPHITITNTKHEQKNDIFLTDKIKNVNGILIPKNKSILDQNILNSQINDYGNLMFTSSIKSLYDTDRILKKSSINENDLIESLSNINHLFYYFTDIQKKESGFPKKLTKINKMRYFLRDKIWKFYSFEKILLRFIIRIKKTPKQIFEFFCNPVYRKYTWKKISNFNITN